MSVKCLIYCSKAKPYLSEEMIDPPFIENKFCLNVRQDINHNRVLNGKIVASFDCEKVEEIIATKWSVGCGLNYYEFETKDLFSKSYLRLVDLTDYLQDKNGYAIHISNLQVFDEPLSFDKDYIYKDYKTNELIEKAPQNMCNVYDRFGNHYVLISIRPEWVCKILNGEKTIEVRKQVVKALKELI